MRTSFRKIGFASLLALLVSFAIPTQADAQTAISEGTVLGFQRVIPVVMETGDDDNSETATAVAIQPGGGRSWYLGVRGGAYFDVDEPFVGVELLMPLGGNLWFNPNFEWVFVDNADLATLNADVHYDLPTDGAYMFWLGAGLGMRYFKLDRPAADGDWDPGLNLLAGLGFGHGDFVPYIQAKYYLGDFNEFVLAGGFRF